MSVFGLAQRFFHGVTQLGPGDAGAIQDLNFAYVLNGRLH